MTFPTLEAPHIRQRRIIPITKKVVIIFWLEYLLSRFPE